MPQPTEEQQKALQEKLKQMSPEELKEFQKQQCIFCQIVSGKVPTKKIYEDELCTAILDIRPAVKGHLLIVPKEHYQIMPHVPDQEIGHFFMVAKYLSQMLLKALKVEGTNLFIANGPVAGQQAQHMIVHLIPRKDGDQVLNFTEKLINQELMGKIKSVVQGKLIQLLGVKEPEAPQQLIEEQQEEKTEQEFQPQQAQQSQQPPEEKEEVYLTSETAKRYHNNKCAFAQNIKEENRIYLTKEETEKSEKKPCTCITGKKIPLKKEKDPFPKPKKEKRKEAANLDDIADMFK